MQVCLAYIPGLFEGLDSKLFACLNGLSNDYHLICKVTELYQGTEFGAYAFQKEIERIQSWIGKIKPDLIVAHSLGGYVALHLNIACQAVLLDPSIAVSDMFVPNVEGIKGGYYCKNKEYNLRLSHEFIESLNQTQSIQQLSDSCEITKVHFIGAGLAGYRVAKEYHTAFTGSDYTFIPNADHNFTNQQSEKEILKIIKKQLGIKPNCD